MAVGNVVGSNIFNILFVLGISSLIVPIPFASGFFVDSMIALLAAVLLWLISLKYRKTGRLSGITFLLIYCGYLAYLLIQR